MHPAEPGDTYIHDGIHHSLIYSGAIVTEPMDTGGRGGHAKHGEWWWSNEVPEDATIDDYFRGLKSAADSGGPADG